MNEDNSSHKKQLPLEKLDIAIIIFTEINSLKTSSYPFRKKTHRSRKKKTKKFMIAKVGATQEWTNFRGYQLLGHFRLYVAETLREMVE